jgi:hypothetical protein
VTVLGVAGVDVVVDVVVDVDLDGDVDVDMDSYHAQALVEVPSKGVETRTDGD